MIRRVPFAALVALIAVLALASATLGAARGTDRPWGGTSVGQTWFDLANPKDCAAGITTRVDQPALATHFGKAFLVMAHCPTGDPADFAADAEFRLTAGNGDAVFGTYGGTLDRYVEVVGEEMLITVTMTVSGGTGRFEGAAGTAVVKIHGTFGGYDVMAWPWSARWEGTLSY